MLKEHLQSRLPSKLSFPTVYQKGYKYKLICIFPTAHKPNSILLLLQRPGDAQEFSLHALANKWPRKALKLGFSVSRSCTLPQMLTCANQGKNGLPRGSEKAKLLPLRSFPI